MTDHKSSKKPLKRIELKKHSEDKKLRLRGSRTGGLAGSYHPTRGLTFSTRYGIRASKTFKGLTLGFQGKRTVFRGRWSAFNGLLNINLSKKGFSFSSSSDHGTYNLSNPRRSSFKFAGIQIRGRKAAFPALIFFIFRLSFSLITAIPSFILFLINTGVLCVKLIAVTIDLLFQLFALSINLLLFLTIDMPLQVFGWVNYKVRAIRVEDAKFVGAIALKLLLIIFAFSGVGTGIAILLIGASSDWLFSVEALGITLVTISMSAFLIKMIRSLSFRKSSAGDSRLLRASALVRNISRKNDQNDFY